MNTKTTPTVLITNRQRKVRLPAAYIRHAVAEAARFAGIVSGTISVVVIRDREMRELNLQYARVDGTTDVLAFDLADDHSPGDEDITGEVIVNADVAAEEASKRGLAPESELTLYIVHGILHLGGCRDGNAVEKKRMRAAEKSVMSILAMRKADAK